MCVYIFKYMCIYIYIWPAKWIVCKFGIFTTHRAESKTIFEQMWIAYSPHSILSSIALNKR